MHPLPEHVVQRSTESFQEHVEYQLGVNRDRTDMLTQQVSLLKEQLQVTTDLLAANTAATNQTRANTAEIIDAFNNLKSAMKVWEWVGRLAKPTAAIISVAVAVAAAWRAWRGHL